MSIDDLPRATEREVEEPSAPWASNNPARETCLCCGGPITRQDLGRPPLLWCSTRCRNEFHSACRRYARRLFQAGLISAETILKAGGATAHGPAAIAGAHDPARCAWCDRPLPARQHKRGSIQKFCCPEHRHAYDTALTRYGALLMAAGLFRVGDMRAALGNASGEARALSERASEIAEHGDASFAVSLAIDQAPPVRVVGIDAPAHDVAVKTVRLDLVAEVPGGGEKRISLFVGHRIAPLIAELLATAAANSPGLTSPVAPPKGDAP